MPLHLKLLDSCHVSLFNPANINAILCVFTLQQYFPKHKFMVAKSPFISAKKKIRLYKEQFVNKVNIYMASSSFKVKMTPCIWVAVVSKSIWKKDTGNEW